jgi:flagellar L-ring protein precursor FlgH
MQDKLKLLFSFCISLSLSGCDLTRLRHIGEQPPLSRVENPTKRPDYHPVSTPLPQSLPEDESENSLWQRGARSFFKDQRACQPGDILTVLVNINDTGQLQNQTKATRSSSSTDIVTAAAGFEQYAKKVLPSSFNLPNLVNLSSNPDHDGNAKINRSEQIRMKLAAMVTQVLPNGNFVINGRQEIRVNQEVRDLQISGIVRPQDISTDNTINYEKIAEARIGYDGRGDMSYVQSPPYGQQFLDAILPF